MADVGNHGLFCLEDENYAAIALYMQCMAEQIDSILSGVDTSLDGALNRPTVIVNSLANKSWTFPNSQRQNIFDNILFSNSDIFTVATSSAGVDSLYIGSPAGTVDPLSYPQGLWMVGATARMATAGGSTAFEARLIDLVVTDDLSTPAGDILARYVDVTPGATGALDAVLVKGPVILRGTHGVRVDARLASAGLLAGGSVTVQAGAMLWATYVGPDELVEVA